MKHFYRISRSGQGRPGGQSHAKETREEKIEFERAEGAEGESGEERATFILSRAHDRHSHWLHLRLERCNFKHCDTMALDREGDLGASGRQGDHLVLPEVIDSDCSEFVDSHLLVSDSEVS
jgi:hypothetical protein